MVELLGGDSLDEVSGFNELLQELKSVDDDVAVVAAATAECGDADAIDDNDDPTAGVSTEPEPPQLTQPRPASGRSSGSASIAPEEASEPVLPATDHVWNESLLGLGLTREECCARVGLRCDIRWRIFRASQLPVPLAAVAPKHVVELWPIQGHALRMVCVSFIRLAVSF